MTGTCEEYDCPFLDEQCLRMLSHRGAKAMARLNRLAAPHQPKETPDAE